MSQENKDQKQGKAKNFFSRWIEKLDKNLEEKAKSGKCCCKSDEGSGKSCCK